MMPRIPTYQPGQVGAVQTTGARFRAADNGGGVAGAFASGMAQVGNAMGQYAQMQDRINAENDGIVARALANEAMAEFDRLSQEYQSLSGSNAREGRDRVLADIKAARNRVVGEAPNGRVRQILSQHLDAAAQSTSSSINQHALKEAKVEHLTAFRGQQDAWKRRALAEADPVQKIAALGMGVKSIEDQLDFMGVADPDARNFEIKRYTSAFHRDVIDAELAKPDPDAEMAFAYFTANSDDMVADDREAVMRDLRKPLQLLQAREDVAIILGDLKPVEGEGRLAPQAKAWSGVAIGVAQRFGLKAEEVAAVISYETAGTFSPTIMGGKGGNYMGLIQFGPEERKKYGITKQSDPKQWTQAIGDFLQDRGFKRGMGLIDLYSTINAGTPGRHNASDGNGTVRTHVDNILREHLPKARQWLGGASGSAEASTWDLQEVYRRIDEVAARDGWGLERREAAISSAEKAVSEREQLFQRAKVRARDAAIRRVVDLGDDRFTSITALPHEIRDDLRRYDPEEYDRLLKLAERNSERKDALPANGSRKIELEMMKRVDPQSFLSVDLQRELGRMPLSEIKSLMIDQAEMTGKRRDAAEDLRPGIVRAIEWGKKYGGLEIPKEQFADVFDHMERVLRERAKKGALTARDYDEAFGVATAPVKTNKTFLGASIGSGSIRANELSLDNISDAAKDEARRNFRLANGREPTDRELLAVAKLVLTGN